MFVIAVLLLLLGALFFVLDAIAPTFEKPPRIRFLSLGLLCWFLLYALPVLNTLNHKLQ